ncbi:hypothetical protein ACIPSE_15555 [Streptomyces sp. NPDC090106]|uniref:hypothetical protein n=1 Tax=Streptomyces sp. NPDC090106 TaxID=3365946 RepID=UPI0038120046
MVVVVLLALLLIAGAVFGVVAQRRQRRGRQERPQTGAEIPAAEPVAAAVPSDGRDEAERWLARLGGGLVGLDAGPDRAAAQALADAGERCRAARENLAAGHYERVTRNVLEGLHYVRGARVALGLDPGPALPALGTPAVTARDGRVLVEAVTYVVSNRRRDATPYYYAGGVVAGRRVPGGWYSAPWWAGRAPALL